MITIFFIKYQIIVELGDPEVLNEQRIRKSRQFSENTGVYLGNACEPPATEQTALSPTGWLDSSAAGWLGKD